MAREIPAVDPSKIPPPLNKCKNSRDQWYRQVLNFLGAIPSNGGSYISGIINHLDKEPDWVSSLVREMEKVGLIVYMTNYGWRLRKGVL